MVCTTPYKVFYTYVCTYVSGEAEHRCCWFHFLKAITDHLKKDGLLERYYADVTFNSYIQQLTSLALIDPNYIDRAFDHLKWRAPEFTGDEFSGLANFLRYFEKVIP